MIPLDVFMYNMEEPQSGLPKLKDAQEWVIFLTMKRFEIVKMCEYAMPKGGIERVGIAASNSPTVIFLLHITRFLLGCGSGRRGFDRKHDDHASLLNLRTRRNKFPCYSDPIRSHLAYWLGFPSSPPPGLNPFNAQCSMLLETSLPFPAEGKNVSKDWQLLCSQYSLSKETAIHF